ncbi:hypothetical protein BDK51DRAFT_48357 [Blyttiomyces helicus]|uniref:Uncharacterized protein n=1 Tax=Blyttiomyces helicus TaxID=388810 RepID=A0A4P9WGK6_9FUNG|nr:hypothetical protein BDK51DRAFT_48357 [Blyttiomyces helicus]|eukprot:RKO89606.1 hypothetical protein BDK51DRAFT_48357 [Blyttiomyces helicus]
MDRVENHITGLFEQTHVEFSTSISTPRLLAHTSTGQTPHLDAILYVFLHRLKPVDREYIRRLARRVAVVPVAVSFGGAAAGAGVAVDGVVGGEEEEGFCTRIVRVRLGDKAGDGVEELKEARAQIIRHATLQTLFTIFLSTRQTPSCQSPPSSSQSFSRRSCPPYTLRWLETALAFSLAALLALTVGVTVDSVRGVAAWVADLRKPVIRDAEFECAGACCKGLRG